eukprot:1370214-Amphidinium_carterae.1
MPVMKTVMKKPAASKALINKPEKQVFPAEETAAMDEVAEETAAMDEAGSDAPSEPVDPAPLDS